MARGERLGEREKAEERRKEGRKKENERRERERKEGFDVDRECRRNGGGERTNDARDLFRTYGLFRRLLSA